MPLPAHSHVIRLVVRCQATEWIVDAALAQGKPFAVVPCCVFSDLFPARRAASGKHVTTYPAFLDYLQAKDASIQRGWLPVEGKSCVLFRLAPAKDLDPGAAAAKDASSDLARCVPCAPET